MSTRTQQRLSTSSLALLAVAFIVAVSVTNQVFKGWRIDLTENNLYTLSDGTRSLLANLEGTVNLYFYFSDQASQAMPSLRNYANRVREMLEEFEAEADGNIRLNVIDPLPFSEDEDRAAQFGLQGVRLGTSPDAVYMGLAGTDSIDNEEIIPFFQLFSNTTSQSSSALCHRPSDPLSALFPTCRWPGVSTRKHSACHSPGLSINKHSNSLRSGISVQA